MKRPDACEWGGDRRAVLAVCVAVCIALFTTGCDEQKTPANGSPRGHLSSEAQRNADRARVEQDVRALLDRWVRAFESRDAQGVRSVLGTGPEFVWMEDGEVRYPSVDSIVAALEGFPKEMVFSHRLVDAKVVPMSQDAAWAQVRTSTEIRMSGRTVSAFEGVVLIVAERDQSADAASLWRIVSAHTSTKRPRGGEAPR